MTDATHIFNFLACNMKMNALKNILEAFCSIIHEAQLKSSLVKEGFCQCPTQCIRRKGRLLAVLELGKEFLQSTEDAGVCHAYMPTQVPEASPKYVQVP